VDLGKRGGTQPPLAPHRFTPNVTETTAVTFFSRVEVSRIPSPLTSVELRAGPAARATEPPTQVRSGSAGAIVTWPY
jgi:hypothetical protein